MAPMRTQFHNLSQKQSESFNEYAQRWRELASRVQPPMMEHEMMDMFTSTLQGQYHMRFSTSHSFAELVTYKERITIRIKLGKIQDVSSAGNAEKSLDGVQKKKDSETSALYDRKGKGRACQESNHQIGAVTIPVDVPQR